MLFNVNPTNFNQLIINQCILIFFNALILLASCSGQTKTIQAKSDNILKGEIVEELGKSIMVIYQDSDDNYWFGSWETEEYKNDGTTITNYTTRHGLPNNRIDEI